MNQDKKLEWKKTWVDLYIQIQKWIRPYLGGRISIKDVDVFAVWPFIEIKKNKRDNFIFIDKKNLYVFHIRSGYLIHAFSAHVFDFIKPKFGTKTIARVDRIEPGRRIVYGERVVEGPRGGKLFALGSATHITTDPNIISNPLTRKYLIRLRLQYKNQSDILWPNIHKVEKRIPFAPFQKIFTYSLEFPWPEVTSLS